MNSTEQILQELDKIDSKFNTEQRVLSDRLTQLEQRPSLPYGDGIQNRGAGIDGVLRSVSEHPGVKALAAGESKATAVIQIKGGIENLLTKTALTNATYSAEAQRLARFGNDIRRPLRLLDVLPRVVMSGATAQYIRLGAYTNAAGYQLTEGTAKPEATVPTSLITATAACVAHWLETSSQVLADTPALEQQLRGLLLFGVLDKLEKELIVGAGTAGTIAGLLGAATVYVSTALSKADRIGETIAQLALTGWQPSVVVLAPMDWFAVASAHGSTGEYVIGSGWNMPPNPNVWGCDVVTSSSLTAGTAIVLDAQQVALLDRQAATVDIGYTGDQFIRNALTVRAELRAALAIYSPAALLKVSISSGT